MRYDFGADEWVELADDPDLTAGEWRLLLQWNDARDGAAKLEQLVRDVLSRIVTGGHLLDRERRAIPMPAAVADYENLPRRKWLWLLRQAWEASLKNLSDSASE